MRYAIDLEYIPQTLDLISLGLVAEDGREYYAVNTKCNHRKADAWVKANVLTQLPERRPEPPPYGSPRAWHDAFAWKPPTQIAAELREFCDPVKYGKPEFWTDCGAFDFVIVSRLFGDFSMWPEGWPYYFGDVQQWADQLGESLPAQTEGQHNALQDARHILHCCQVLDACGPLP